MESQEGSTRSRDLFAQSDDAPSRAAHNLITNKARNPFAKSDPTPAESAASEPEESSPAGESSDKENGGSVLDGLVKVGLYIFPQTQKYEHRKIAENGK